MKRVVEWRQTLNRTAATLHPCQNLPSTPQPTLGRLSLHRQLYQVLCQFATRQAAHDSADRQNVVTVRPVFAVVDEARHAGRRPPLLDGVVVVDRVRQRGSRDTERQAEVPVHRLTDHRNTTVMAIQTGNSQNTGVTWQIADGDGMLGLYPAVKAAQNKHVLGIESHVELHHHPQLRRDNRTTIDRHLAQSRQNVSRPLCQYNRVVAVVLNHHTARAAT